MRCNMLGLMATLPLLLALLPGQSAGESPLGNSAGFVVSNLRPSHAHSTGSAATTLFGKESSPSRGRATTSSSIQMLAAKGPRPGEPVVVRMEGDKGGAVAVRGTIVEALPGGSFKIELDNGGGLVEKKISDMSPAPKGTGRSPSASPPAKKTAANAKSAAAPAAKAAAKAPKAKAAAPKKAAAAKSAAAPAAKSAAKAPPKAKATPKKAAANSAKSGVADAPKEAVMSKAFLANYPVEKATFETPEMGKASEPDALVANYPLDGPTFEPKSKAAAKGKSGAKATAAAAGRRKNVAAASKKAAGGAKPSGKAAAAPLPAALLENYPLSLGTYLIPAGSSVPAQLPPAFLKNYPMEQGTFRPVSTLDLQTGKGGAKAAKTKAKATTTKKAATKAASGRVAPLSEALLKNYPLSQATYSVPRVTAPKLSEAFLANYPLDKPTFISAPLMGSSFSASPSSPSSASAPLPPSLTKNYPLDEPTFAVQGSEGDDGETAPLSSAFTSNYPVDEATFSKGSGSQSLSRSGSVTLGREGSVTVTGPGTIEIKMEQPGSVTISGPGTVTLKKDGEDAAEVVRGAAGGEPTSPASGSAEPADEGVLGGLGKLFDNIVNRFSDKYLGDD